MWYILLAIFGLIAEQTDWMGGPGVLGPVSNWGTQFWQSESVTVATPGQVSLVATQWNYSNWVKYIVEQAPSVGRPQGLAPADIDNDGDLDLVAYSDSSAVWYENQGNYTFNKHTIGPLTPCWGDPHEAACSHTWPFDLDNDIDVVAVNCRTGTQTGDPYLFRNDGSMNFTKELIYNTGTDTAGWRCELSDFNSDGYPDLYLTSGYQYIFINDGSGNFVLEALISMSNNYYTDGGIAGDIDLDGLPQI